MPTPSRKPSLTSLIAFGLIALPATYVLSYAPVVRVCGGDEWIAPEDLPELPGHNVIGINAGPRYPVFEPVERLSDNTWIRQAMFWWAGLWEVRDHFQIVAFHRDRRGHPLSPLDTRVNVRSSCCAGPETGHTGHSVWINVEH